MEALIFDESTHTYTWAGRTLPSVTTIIRPISPDLTMIPPDVLARKRALGTAVHLACELDDLGELGEIDDELAPFLRAWQQFKTDTGAKIIANERRLHHPALGFAGTLDRLAWLENVGRENWLIDLKTAADPSPSYGVQLAGYALLLEADGEPIEDLRRGTVHLRPDGTYRLHEFKDPRDAACFRALLCVHQWKWKD